MSRVNEAVATLTASQSPSSSGRGANWYIHPENYSLRNMSIIPVKQTEMKSNMKKSIIFTDPLLQSGKKNFHYNMSFTLGFEGLRTAACMWEIMSISLTTKYHLVHLENLNCDSKFVWWRHVSAGSRHVSAGGRGEEKNKNGRKRSVSVQMEICRHYNICWEGLNICVIQNL